ncbi:YIP1 family protein [Halobacillus sp. Marseille-Q1614]|uniref:YIP1 family protein n=1 Tax=Halobacillus sp. Marseille-Q1614 TaxID=2709134 RepID=UPI00156FCDE1|nr:YIP1 family protein [Halobacillus sp. Marseille-Q1614]
MREFFILVFCFCFITLFPTLSSASVSVPYKTETLTADGNVIETQAAYSPIGLFGKGTEIVNPEDIYIDQKDQVYIADSGTQTVTKFDEDGNVLKKYGEGLLNQPLGVYADENGEVYVADYGSEKVFKFEEDGEVIQEYGRPESPLFGKKAPYKPEKVSVDKRGNIYIIGESATNGIIQLSQDGTFLGYYGANTLAPSLGTFLQDMITTQRQRANLFMKEPPAPGNISIDDQGLVYTVTSGTTWESIRKLNIEGGNILPADMTEETNLVDIAVGSIGNIFTVGNDGIIYEYDSSGNLLFSFGGKTSENNRLGLMMQPSSIEVDNVGRIYLTDREQGNIQIFEPTEFTTTLHQGLALFEEGYYVESEEYWNEILRLNSSFGLAHTAKGEALYKQQEYDEALEEFKLANDKDGYSNAFWEIRYRWMESNLAGAFLLIFAFFTARYTVRFMDKKKNILQPVKNTTGKIKRKKLVGELLFLTRFIKKPIDSIYYLKNYEQVSVLSAALLYLILVVEYLMSIYWTGFLFTNRVLENVNIFFEAGTVLLPLFLFIVVNYLVSTITDGEGKFRDVFIGTIYSLAPIILFILPITLISNTLTFNEAFIYTFSLQIIIVWSIIILFTTIKEIHDFSFWGTVRNILITLFGMFLSVLVFFVLYVLFDQLYSFVSAIIEEVVLRV